MLWKKALSLAERVIDRPKLLQLHNGRMVATNIAKEVGIDRSTAY